MSRKVIVENNIKLGLPQDALVATPKRMAGLQFVWWGKTQWYKWRWNETHADMGMLSIYGIKRPLLWLPLKWLMKPMRLYYHKYYVNTRSFNTPHINHKKED